MTSLSGLSHGSFLLKRENLICKAETTKMKLSSEGWGWVAVIIGMGIGAGIVFSPVAAGLAGLWTFLPAVLIAYPALYQFQRPFYQCAD